ncbi:unnamed protein product [Heterobilharzia americana]|nr:unnamed protein product [Heterobilharzia americana]
MLLSFLRSQLDIPLYCLWLIATLLLCNLNSVCGADTDDDFAEFQDPDDSFTIDITEPVPIQSVRQQKAESIDKNISESSSHASSEIDSDDGSTLHATKPSSFDRTTLEDSELEVELDNVNPDDDEEFEGLSSDQPILNADKNNKGGKRNLIIAKVPHHLTRSWDNFHLEMLFIMALLIYILNFVIGRSKNTQLASSWFTVHQSLLEANFAVVGDDGQAEPGNGALMKESEHLYSLWCTGTVHCDAMLIELRLVKRQCLFFAIANWIRPVHDSIVVKVIMDDSEMDGWVMAVGRKRRLQALSKDHQDLAVYCPDKRGQRHQYLPESFTVLSEISEVVPAILNPLVCKFLTDHEESIDYLFFSDQYSGPKPPQEDTNIPTKPPVTQKALIFAFRCIPTVTSKSTSKLTSNDETVNHQPMESNTALFHFIFYMIEKVRRFRLSKEGKGKSERNRQRTHDSRLKSMHSQRQEAAQNRRGERMRAVKERIMAEDDPDKARKLEEKEQRKEKAKKMPRMKMLKMK